MSNKPRTYAFIDSQNLIRGLSQDVRTKSKRFLHKGRKIDLRKLHDYLRTKHNVQKAFLFIGKIPGNEPLYDRLKGFGYELIFKKTSAFLNDKGEWMTKGNVDTDIVLYSSCILYDEYDKAVFTSGDGDFISLYEKLDHDGKLERILVPNQYCFSKLLRKYRPKMTFVNQLPKLFRRQN